MQIIMILITYQKMFSFTHNDLHTNNIMYIPTNKKFLYYLYKKKYYWSSTYVHCMLHIMANISNMVLYSGDGDGDGDGEA